MVSDNQNIEPQQVSQREKYSRLNPPEPEVVEASLRFFQPKRPRKIYLTLVFQLIVNSMDKMLALLVSHKYITNFKIRVLEAFREDLKKVQPDRAFACVLEMLEQQDRKKQQQKAEDKDERESDPSTVLGNIIARRFNQRYLLPEDYSFSVKLRDGAYRDCAKVILQWSAMFIKAVPLPEDDERNLTPVEHQNTSTPQTIVTPELPLPSIERIHELWVEWDKKYQDALSHRVPFGRHKGKMLKHVGKRDLRWILDRMPPADVVDNVIAALDLLLGYSATPDPREIETAKLVEHPWRRVLKHERAVRLRHIDMRVVDPPGALILLGALNDEEKERLRDELLEQKHNRAAFNELRQAMEIALYDRPPRYPSIRLTALPEGDEADQAELLRRYRAAVEWFSDPFPTGETDKPFDEYTPEELADFEADQQGELLRTEAALGLPVLQPLSFKRSMRPGADPDAFTLLYDKESGAYVLAIVVQGRKRFAPPVVEKRRRAKLKEPIKQFKPTIGKTLYFFSFPDKPYVVPKRTSVLMFSLKYGRDYHEAKFLEPALTQLRANQALITEIPDGERTGEADGEKQQQADGTSSEDTTVQQETQKKVTRGPKALIASARIVCRWSEKDGPRFFAHLPIPIPVPDCLSLPTKVLGIHEHRDGYSYALLSLAGEVTEVGDLAINPDVVPREGDTIYNPNYAAEVVAAIIELAERHDVYIGIQDTSYLREAGLSRTQNRAVFSRPSRRVISILNYKTLLNENVPLMKPRLTDDVSESRDCSRCRDRMPKGYNGVRRVTYVVCPQCRERQPLQVDEDTIQRCRSCSSDWRAYEAFVECEFVCKKCDAPPMPARYNTAIVVAQQTLVQLVNHHDWLKEHPVSTTKRRTKGSTKRTGRGRRRR